MGTMGEGMHLVSTTNDFGTTYNISKFLFLGGSYDTKHTGLPLFKPNSPLPLTNTQGSICENFHVTKCNESSMPVYHFLQYTHLTAWPPLHDEFCQFTKGLLHNEL